MSEDIVLKRYNKEKNEWISIPVIAIQDNKAVVEISDFNPKFLLVIPAKHVARVITTRISREVLKELEKHAKEIVAGTAVSEATSVFVYYLLTHVFRGGKPVNIKDGNLKRILKNAIEAVVESEEKRGWITAMITYTMLACQNLEAIRRFAEELFGVGDEEEAFKEIKKRLRATTHTSIATIISEMLKTEDFLKRGLVTDRNMMLLRGLFANWKGIKCLDGLEYANNLRYLFLMGNQITDITPLVNNPGLGRGDSIWLNNNPLDLTPGSQNMQDIETLQARRVFVRFDGVVEPVDPYVETFLLDTNLEAAIRDALGKPTGNITKEDMAKLTNLEANRRRIIDLSGLEYAVNLTSLNLHGNQITDITPLAGLTNLTRLYLGGNQITDITPLAELTNLTRLNLSYNQITDITPLAGLTNLTNLNLLLNLGDNQITDITPLVINTGLGYGDIIWLDDNPLDLTPGSRNMRDIETLQARGVIVYFR
ncbi:leucine-rich repeat domain-containing protein [Peptococcaceae bacterium]|nr:leucine-rich repeat domain-containing protein [Peptococcaceae bacterium]